MSEFYSRRRFVATAGAAGIAALAGCSGGDGDGDGGDETVVEVGPDGSLAFEPEEVTVSVGDTVTWDFVSPSHNVSAYPDMDENISIPEDASGFGTMEEGGDSFATVEQGETFEHTFETAGEYTYVCVPHVSSDMIGTVVVE